MTRESDKPDHYFSAKPKSKAKYGLLRVQLRGRCYEFLTASGVFSKDRVDLGTLLLVESMILPDKGNVLDIGCGYGVVGVVAAVSKPELNVFMVDVNARAVRLARKNVEKNGAQNVSVKRGNLYEPFGNVTFDCVLSNPPVSAGMKTLEAIIADAPVHMNKAGVFQMVVRSKVAGERLQRFFEDAFGDFEVISRKSGYRVMMSKIC